MTTTTPLPKVTVRAGSRSAGGECSPSQGLGDPSRTRGSEPTALQQLEELYAEALGGVLQNPRSGSARPAPAGVNLRGAEVDRARDIPDGGHR